jgi:hypothetical protein
MAGGSADGARAAVLAGVTGTIGAEAMTAAGVYTRDEAAAADEAPGDDDDAPGNIGFTAGCATAAAGAAEPPRAGAVVANGDGRASPAEGRGAAAAASPDVGSGGGVGAGRDGAGAGCAAGAAS